MSKHRREWSPCTARTLRAPHQKRSPFGSFLLTMAYPPKCAWLHLFTCWSEFFPFHLRMYLAQNHLCAASSSFRATILACRRTPLRAMLLSFHFLVLEVPLFFCLDFEFFTFLPLLHQNESWLHIAALQKSSFLLSCAGPNLRRYSQNPSLLPITPARSSAF